MTEEQGRLARYHLPRIKKCPFCGGRSRVTSGSKTYIKGELTQITYCYCMDCDSRGRRVIFDEYETKKEAYLMAIAHWNRRINDEDRKRRFEEDNRNTDESGRTFNYDRPVSEWCYKSILQRLR